MKFQPYIKTARELGTGLAWANGNEVHRDNLLRHAHKTIARFAKVNPLFVPKYSAERIAQIAFPNNPTQHPSLIADLLKKNN